MKNLWFYVIAICFAIVSCTKAKTDYEAEISTVVTEHYEFKEAVSINSAGYKISIEALNGTFYKGYNEIRLKITNQTNQPVNASAIKFLPVMTGADGSKTSCPHKYDLVYKADSNYFSGYTVFTSESNAAGSWELYVSFTINNQTYDIQKDISVEEQTNKNLNMTTFTGKDGEQYYIALVAPQKPKVAENELVAGIYKFDKPSMPAGTFPDPSQFSYSEVSGYTLQLDPRMPEPSMGNHSSINNKDLIQQNDGLYYGVVNYTMTGNWTLNFIMLNQNGQIVKGTVVPKDFTPGVEGVKSELYIDILF
ncbi:FixH family protein [Niabella beijingensis]|uniref:FixH family protein n=1 Tax=Niabella beijingensis TaxID=2872700 RepID=UPI001CC1BFF0|nr:FixH family protein [Niabella beijingensis]MBZ4190542.1 FixH family protein [Niabella beijingensis]